MFQWVDISGVLVKMSDSAEKLGKGRLGDGNQVSEDSEFVRLVISNEPRAGQGESSLPLAETNSKSFIWGAKLYEKLKTIFVHNYFVLCFIYVVIFFVYVGNL